IAVLDSSLLQSVINTQRVVHLPGMKTKQIKMDPKSAGAMKNQLRAFKKKFGREPSRLARTTPCSSIRMPTRLSRYPSKSSARARQSLRLQRRLAWTQTAFCEHSASTTKARVRHDTRWIRCRGWFSYCHPPEVERRLESANA